MTEKKRKDNKASVKASEQVTKAEPKQNKIPNYLENRYFTKSDPKENTYIFPINSGWWSRVYEYKWAMNFLNKNDKVLDLACGLPHPFRFVAEKITGNAYACDLDGNIKNQEQTLNAIRYQHGDNAVKLFMESLEDYKAIFDKSFKSDIRDIQAENECFDTVFCISVLEHLETKEDVIQSLKEIYRVLQFEGIAVLSVDYPNIEPEFLVNEALKIGFKLLDNNVNYEIPENAITTNYLGQDLKVFRLSLKK